jgi:hypothetical protein
MYLLISIAVVGKEKTPLPPSLLIPAFSSQGDDPFWEAVDLYYWVMSLLSLGSTTWTLTQARFFSGNQRSRVVSINLLFLNPFTTWPFRLKRRAHHHHHTAAYRTYYRN